MSKKKSTMTLKDFHGGSIPSDLPLPSAPGVTARPLSNSGFDRQTPWGNPAGRLDHRLRPGSAGAVRTFDDKSPFLTNSARIGRNFDEDERKPLDGGSGPRRTVSDESIHGGVPIRQEPKLDYSRSGPIRPATTPVSNISTGGVSTYAARFSEGVNNVGVHSQNSFRSYSSNEGKSLGVSNQFRGSGPSPNPWGMKKEAARVAEPPVPSWSAPDAATKLAHASALEKVSSGRWNLKQQQHTDIEVIGRPEPEPEVNITGNMLNNYPHSSEDVYGGRGFHQEELVNHVNRSLAVDDRMHVGSRDLPTFEKSRSYIHPDIERKSPVYANEVPVQPRGNAGEFGGSELRRPLSADSSERPKLKLLPRSKPVENIDPSVDCKQPYAQKSYPGHLDNVSESYGNRNSTVPGSAGLESGNVATERPKLSLKPRSQPVELPERNTERDRSALFGGARPRELVLKDRGVDDVVVNNQDIIQSPNRMKQDSPKIETSLSHSATAIRPNGKVEVTPVDHRAGKNFEKSDAERKNWRNDNRRNNTKEHDKQQKVQERPPSPETWRKPVEPSVPEPPRLGKAASPVDLALAFSKSVSNSKLATDRPLGQRGLPSQVQIPFSRLTTQPPRSHISGY